jgi:penicillin-insensitive murein endopeptidase
VGFIRRRPWRRTAFGHPDLVDYIERLGEATRRAELGSLVVGDMALPRGGAFAHGHRSHQTGLDVDIAYQTLPENGSLRPIVTVGSSMERMPSLPRDPRLFETLLRLAAADARVDRIFVAAGIKQLLCRSVTGDRGFLAVLRPWQGHERHFHVRLKCPADSPDCHPNEPATAVPDSCEDLARGWKNASARTAFAEFFAAERASYVRDLPHACRLLPELPRDMALLPSRHALRRMSVAARRALRSPHASPER